MAQVLYTPTGRSIQVQDLVSLYKEHAAYPSPGSASVRAGTRPGTWIAYVSHSGRDCVNADKNTVAQNILIEEDRDTGKLTVVEETDAAEGLVKSPSGRQAVNFRKEAKGEKEKEWADLLTGKRKVKIDLDSLQVHGPVIRSDPFAGFSWSPDEKYVLYVAEKKELESKSYYKKSDENEKVEPGNEYLFREDWGEALDKVVHPVVCILNVETEKVQVVDMHGYSLADPVWIDNKNFAFVGWEEGVRRLGIIYCTNRKSQIFTCDTDSLTPVPIDQDTSQTRRCPRPSPDGKSIVFLENSSAGAHHKASRLCVFEVPSRKTSLLLDKVVEDDPEAGTFYKYVEALPQRCWSSDSKSIIIDVQALQKNMVICVNVATKSVKTLPLPATSAVVKDYSNGLIVASASSITTRPVFHVARFESEASTALNWLPLDKFVATDHYSYINEKLTTSSGNDVYTFLVSPSGLEKEPGACFVMIHGGPHSTFIDTYYMYLSMITKLGFKCLLINFRGSTGFGEEFLKALPGAIGDVDVKDCIAAVDHFVVKNLIDPKRLVLWGGSHGGFLSTHLSGQYAHYDWLACCTRNPVIDVSTMLEVTDIPDWCVYESSGNEKEYSDVDEQDLKGMWDKSPIRWINQVKTPTLVALGSNDRRVPMSQGMKWYRGLKARGIETKCLVYPDKHDLMKVEVDSDYFVNVLIWVLSRLNVNGNRK